MKVNALILITILFLNNCAREGSFIVKLWDGYYARQNTSIAFAKEEQAFYDNEPIEKKILREKNNKRCNKIINTLFNKKQKIYGEGQVNKSDIYVHCMRVNHTPLYRDIPQKYDWLKDEDVRFKD
ncbi:hypothetical protein BKK52_11160 [Rodentibacter trehalosifermentans]|uniref:Uncharacterized protein n=1 Tax=Rodentibacter trehalosifermentans TaxID=1908263 RepID=A0A1V3IX04_9PAST|nr:hypothetical protein [Rodentibacter trehalosifermentans]OOF46633.1 hypothetical protein BKK52_11160 [Rodentibacter trehalosifermentans]